MSSKEYCLVPKSTMEEYIRKFTVESAPVPSYQKPLQSQNLRDNSNIENLIELFIEGKYRKYGLNLLKYYVSKPIVHIDADGNFLRPVTGLNIMDLINFYSLNKGSSDVKEKIIMLNSLIPLPEFYIRNKKSRNYIYTKPSSPPLEQPPPLSPPSPTSPSHVLNPSPPPTPPTPLQRAPSPPKVTRSKRARMTSSSPSYKRGDSRWEPY